MCLCVFDVGIGAGAGGEETTKVFRLGCCMCVHDAIQLC